MQAEENKKISLPFFGIPRLWPFIRPYRRILIINIILGILSSLIDSLYPLFNSYALNHFVAEETLKGILPFAAAYAAILVLQVIDNFVSTYQCGKVEMSVDRDLRNASFNHLQTLSFSYFNQNSVGYVHARVMSDTDRIASTLAWGLMEGVWYIAYLLFAIVMMFVLNWKLALGVMVIVPVLAVSGVYFQKKLVVGKFG